MFDKLSQSWTFFKNLLIMSPSGVTIYPKAKPNAFSRRKIQMEACLKSMTVMLLKILSDSLARTMVRFVCF